MWHREYEGGKTSKPNCSVIYTLEIYLDDVSLSEMVSYFLLEFNSFVRKKNRDIKVTIDGIFFPA